MKVPRRRRRYGDLPTRTWAILLAGWVALSLLAWQFLPGIGERIFFAVLTGACLLVVTRPSVRGSR